MGEEFAVSDSSTQFSNKKSEGNTTILLRTVACVVAHRGSEFLLGGSSQTPFPVPSPLQKYILTLLRFTDEKLHTCQIVSDSSTRVYGIQRRAKNNHESLYNTCSVAVKTGE